MGHDDTESNTGRVRTEFLLESRYQDFARKLAVDERISELFNEKERASRVVLDAAEKLVVIRREIALENGLIYEDRQQLLDAVKRMTGEDFELTRNGLLPKQVLDDFKEAWKVYGSELASGPPTEKAIKVYFCGARDEPGCGYVLGHPAHRVTEISIGGRLISREGIDLCRVCERQIE